AAASRRLALLVPLLLQVMVGLPAAGQNATPSAPPPTPAGAGPADDYGRSTPRGALRRFLEARRAGDFPRAANYLDLRRLPQATRTQQGPALAEQLCTVIDRTVWVDPEQLSDAPEGERDDGLPSRRDLATTIPSINGPVPVLLERVPRDNGT